MMNNRLNRYQNIQLNRRNLLKMAVTGAVASVALSSVTFIPPVAADENVNSTVESNNKKILIVYFSRSGNTKNVAEQIQLITGGDIIELKTVKPYPNNYHETTVQAQKELSDNFYPELSTTISNINQYDVVLIGSPNWWGTMSSPVRSFLSHYNLANKDISIFITHEGSGLGNGMRDLRSFCPNAKIHDGLAIRGGQSMNAKSEIIQWLNSLGLSKEQ